MVGSVLSVINSILPVDQSQSQAPSLSSFSSSQLRHLVQYTSKSKYTHPSSPFHQLIQLTLLRISVAIRFPCYCTTPSRATTAVRLVVFPCNPLDRRCHHIVAFAAELSSSSSPSFLGRVADQLLPAYEVTLLELNNCQRLPPKLLSPPSSPFPLLPRAPPQPANLFPSFFPPWPKLRVHRLKIRHHLLSPPPKPYPAAAPRSASPHRLSRCPQIQTTRIITAASAISSA